MIIGVLPSSFIFKNVSLTSQRLKSDRSSTVAGLSAKRATGKDSHPKNAKILRTLPHDPPADILGNVFGLPFKITSKATSPVPMQIGFFFAINYFMYGSPESQVKKSSDCSIRFFEYQIGRASCRERV